MTLNEHETRLQRLTQLKEAWVIPYANKYDKTHDITTLIKIGSDATSDGEILMNEWAKNTYSTAWRMMSFRTMGRLSFSTIRDHTGDIQICFVKWLCNFYTGQTLITWDETLRIWEHERSSYKIAEKFFDIGDFIWVTGELFVTKHGELTLFVNEYQMLSKALRPLGDKRHGIQNDEKKYRQRYLDMTMNEESYNIFVMKSKILKALREFYRSRDFHEIETSIFWNSASGTAAQPFVTHHNDFDIDLYLRVATEPQNKMATVGRFERVFEIGKDFRNEWSDPTHLQEFTMIEHYAVYRNYEDNMRFTEELFDHLFSTLELPRIRKVKNKAGESKEVDFTTPRQRIDYISQIKKDCGIDVSSYGPEDEQTLRETIKKAWFSREWIDIQATATMIDYLYKKVTRPQILWPAFIYNYPKTMQPLARRNDENQWIVEQFQLVVNGVEILKAYSELVDPTEQKENFDEQKEAQERGDEETTAADEDFLLAMEHGMPPQSWRGMGIERLCAILLEQDNLRDVTMFPLMKPIKTSTPSPATPPPSPLLKGGGTSLTEGSTVIQRQYKATPAYVVDLAKKLRTEQTPTEKIFREVVRAKRLHWLKRRRQHPFGRYIADFYCHVAKLAIEIDGTIHELTDIQQRDEGKEWYINSYDVTVLRYTNDEVKNDLESVLHNILEYIYTKSPIAENNNTSNNSPSSKEGAGGRWREETDPSLDLASNLIEWTDIDHSILPQLDQVESLMDKYLEDTKRHCHQVGHVMKYFAHKLWQNEAYRYTVWLLHDIDRDHIWKDAAVHLWGQFEEIVGEIDLDPRIIDDIRSHYEETGVPVNTLVRKYLAAVDELSWLIYAYSLMRPKGLQDMNRKSLNKKIKDKKFAAWVDREHVRYCEKYLDIPLSEFAIEVADAMSTLAV